MSKPKLIRKSNNTPEYNRNYYLTKTKPDYSKEVYCEQCDMSLKKYSLYKHIKTKGHKRAEIINRLKEIQKEPSILDFLKVKFDDDDW